MVKNSLLETPSSDTKWWILQIWQQNASKIFPLFVCERKKKHKDSPFQHKSFTITVEGSKPPSPSPSESMTISPSLIPPSTSQTQSVSPKRLTITMKESNFPSPIPSLMKPSPLLIFPSPEQSPTPSLLYPETQISPLFQRSFLISFSITPHPSALSSTFLQCVDHSGENILVPLPKRNSSIDSVSISLPNCQQNQSKGVTIFITESFGLKVGSVFLPPSVSVQVSYLNLSYSQISRPFNLVSSMIDVTLFNTHGTPITQFKDKVKICLRTNPSVSQSKVWLNLLLPSNLLSFFLFDSDRLPFWKQRISALVTMTPP